MQLLTAQERKQGYYFKHVIEGLLRANSKDRAEFYSKMLNNGVMSINEVRALENLNPVAGGDIHLVPLNMTSLENAGKPPEQLIPAVPAEPATTDEENKQQKKINVYPMNPLKVLKSPGSIIGGQNNENSEPQPVQT